MNTRPFARRGYLDPARGGCGARPYPGGLGAGSRLRAGFRFRRPAGTTLLPASFQLPVSSPTDVVLARRQARRISVALGASPVETTLVNSVISELARNIFRYSGIGRIDLDQVAAGGRKGIMITATEQGPGFADAQRAILGGYSTSRRLAWGLCGVRGVADEFEVSSVPANGTTVTVRKWFRHTA